MEEGKPSFTAMGSAMARAKHLLWDAPPKIFEDPFAFGLSGLADEKALRERLDAVLAEFSAMSSRDVAQAAFTSVGSEIVVRSRYAEDELAQAIKRGIRQYVILGAGLDSFALRRPDLARRLGVYEVDYPATQQWKRTRLQELKLEIPPNLIFVPVNFEKDSLVDSLRNSGYRSNEPGFFSWLAVTQYLTRDAIFDTLRMVASLASGSEIILEYYAPGTVLDYQDSQILRLYADWAAAQGEPHYSYFEPAELEMQVRKMGFAEVWGFGPKEAHDRYFTNRTDGLRSRISRFMGARV